MVVVDINNNNQIIQMYIDNGLKKKIDSKVIPCLKQKDEDYVVIVDGNEGTGKSTFAMQLAKYVDPTFDIPQVCFTPHQFRDAIQKAHKYQAIVYDEAFRGLSSRGSLSEVNKMLVSLMQEMRQLNLCIIVCIPTYFMLEKYVALWRARILFTVYKHKGKKGFWRAYGRKQKQLIYLKGKKDYSYRWARPKMRGRFTAKYVLDEKTYRNYKERALRDGFKVTVNKDNELMANPSFQRAVIEEKRQLGIGTPAMSKLLKSRGLNISHQTVWKWEKELTVAPEA